MNPSVTVVVPCHNEVGFVDRLLASMLPQVAATDEWRIVAVDDSSTDATGDVLRRLGHDHHRLSVISGRYGSPGGARSAGCAAAVTTHDPDWIVTTDADVELPGDWLESWRSSITSVQDDDEVGAINGVENQDHLYARFPNASAISAAFGRGVERSESLIGITNLNGVNHGIRASAYRTAGPYLQPVAPGPDGPINLAGEDWDLGVRLRLAGYRIGHTPAAVIDRGRRLLADVHAYVSGEAYEGAFLRLAPGTEPVDVPDHEVDALASAALRRSLRHFYLKPLLAGAVPLDAHTGLASETLADMGEWIRRWPHPSFTESRNGFIFGRLERFADEFTDRVLRELGLVAS